MMNNAIGPAFEIRRNIEIMNYCIRRIQTVFWILKGEIDHTGKVIGESIPGEESDGARMLIPVCQGQVMPILSGKPDCLLDIGIELSVLLRFNDLCWHRPPSKCFINRAERNHFDP